MGAFRYRFWLLIHNGLEDVWHWVYYNKLHTTADHAKHTSAKGYGKTKS